MILDIIVILLFIVGIFRGWKKGLLWSIASFLAVIVGIFLSLKLAHLVADYLQINNIFTSRYMLIISYLLIFLTTFLIFKFVSKLLEKLLDIMFLGLINNLLGALLYGVFMLFIASSLLWLVNEAKLVSEKYKVNSKAYQVIEPLAPKAIQIISPYIPYCNNIIKEVENHFDALLKKENK